MQVLMYINIRHNPAAVGIILQIVNHPVHLVHHPLTVLMLYAHLIPVSLPNRTFLVSPAVPNMAVQLINIIRLLLPDPKQLVHTALDPRPAQRKRRKLLPQIIPVHNPKSFYRISRRAILPHGTHLFPLRTGAMINNITAHSNKNLICVTHVAPSSKGSDPFAHHILNILKIIIYFYGSEML